MFTIFSIFRIITFDKKNGFKKIHHSLNTILYMIYNSNYISYIY